MPQAPRIELHPVSQRVQVHVGGKLLADSSQALEFRETGYPPRHYFPPEAVRMDLLTPLQKRPPTARLKGIRCIFRWAKQRYCLEL
ncbi:DUF427 domain-containing protein [Vreelandella titanicae]|uniref:DUF427 domain-containing protein n=1 Tax=Vreelandella titanicae TaxID=664683 RepID=UPI003FD8793C